MDVTETFECGRRREGGVAANFPGPDTWRERTDPYHMGPTCSYCGSISPEVFFEAIEAGHEIEPTDKNYKVYLRIPNPNPQALRVNGGSSGGDCPEWGTNDGGYWKREGEMTPAERELANACGWGVDRDAERRKDHWINFGPAGELQHGKFYYQHLDEEGRARFLDLVNDGKINFGYPGHLYRTPYFARTKEKA